MITNEAQNAQVVFEINAFEKLKGFVYILCKHVDFIAMHYIRTSLFQLNCIWLVGRLGSRKQV